MSLANPLSVASFLDTLEIEDIEFEPVFTQKRSLPGGGDAIYADRAPVLFSANNVTTAPMELAAAEAAKALLNSRSGGLKTLLLYNVRLPYPSSDPDGSIFGSATPAVGTITNNLHVAFTAYPHSYSLPVGTWFGIIFDTSRYYIGQIMEARTANASTGAVSSVEIWPPLPDAVATSDAVTVLKPPGKFTPTPGTAKLSQVGGNLARLTFSAMQTYRP